jgi:5'-deoxynucleotidase YfbR-like HD superfamily hydrolase
MNLKKVIQSGGVVRFHAHTGIDKQTNAAHQWGVAVVVAKIAPHCRKELLLAALTHDTGEFLSGDCPFNVKAASPVVKAVFDEMESNWRSEMGVNWEHILTSEEKVILKMADYIEGLMFCIQQMKQGNRSANRPYRYWESALGKLVEAHSTENWFSLNDVLGMLEKEKGKWYE